MSSRVYDPSKNSVRIAGHTLVGVLEIKVNRGNDSYKEIKGIHPIYAARVKTFTQPFKLTVKLLHTSPSNLVMQHLYASSEAMFNSFFRVEVLSQGSDGEIKSNLASTGYIVSAPDLVMDNESDDKQWHFVVNAFDTSGHTDLIV